LKDFFTTNRTEEERNLPLPLFLPRAYLQQISPLSRFVSVRVVRG